MGGGFGPRDWVPNLFRLTTPLPSLAAECDRCLETKGSKEASRDVAVASGDAWCRARESFVFLRALITMKFLFGKGDLFSNPLRSQISPALICVSLFLIIVAKFIYDGRRPHGRHIEYNLIWLANNYFQFGAMRRALVGSVIYISGIDLVAAAYLLYGISISLILLFAYVFIRRIRQASGTLLPFALILGALLLFWSEKSAERTPPWPQFLWRLLLSPRRQDCAGQPLRRDWPSDT